MHINHNNNNNSNNMATTVEEFIVSLSSSSMLHLLVQCEQQITFALQGGGVVVYWSHIIQPTNSFDWLTVTDVANYRVMMKRLRSALRDGLIDAVSAGDPITVDGTELHTMLVTIPGTYCAAYMLLHRQGNLFEVKHTPYFFTSRKSRDDAIEYMTKK